MMTKSPGELPSLHFLGIIRLEVGEEPGDLGTVGLPLVCGQLLRMRICKETPTLCSDIFSALNMYGLGVMECKSEWWSEKQPSVW